MADMTKIGAELSSAAAIVPPERAAAVAREVYGLSGTVEWLWGEKDSNYRLVTPGGREFLLKILTPGEDAGVTDMHSRALAHLAARDPELPVQRVIRTRQGELDARMGDGRGVRLVTFLSGTAQAAGPVTDAQRHAVGVLLRRTQRALADFTHPSAHHRLAWDTTHAGDLAGHIPLLPPDWRAEVAATLDDFAAVAPHLASLPAQVIHNDFNRGNILVDGDTVTGVIDFGDLCHATRLIDVTVAASYQQSPQDPVGSVMAFLSGYGPLTDAERRYLWPALRARIAMRLLIPYWRASLFPEQAERFLVSCPAAWTQLCATRPWKTLP